MRHDSVILKSIHSVVYRTFNNNDDNDNNNDKDNDDGRCY
jgi:hypothetical protein